MCLFHLQCLEECDGHGLPPTEQGRLDLELKIEDTKENMRKAEVCMIPILAVILCAFEYQMKRLINLSCNSISSLVGSKITQFNPPIDQDFQK